MTEQKLTGVFFSVNGQSANGGIDISEVKKHTEQIPSVAFTQEIKVDKLPALETIVSKIKEKNLKRLVIAGDMPGMAKSFFTKAMVSAGNNPDDVVLASFREHGAIKKTDTARAKAIINCAVYGVSFEDVAIPDETAVHPATLVIGGGIAGIQASLEIANAGKKVYLVEKTPTIGGHMAMFDKTFPTLDCAACILTPKMVEVDQNPNIELYTYAELESVDGFVGNFKVKIRQKAKSIDFKNCTGCNICIQKCPVKDIPDEFNAGLTMRKAIYVPFPQAVPNKPVIDRRYCTYFLKGGKCGICKKFCPADAVDFDQKDEIIEVEVGNIIAATGFKIFDAKRIENFGYGKYPNVFTSLEFERLLNASGPTEGTIKLRTKDKQGRFIFDSKEPRSVAIIHCVGSRDENYNKYCSRVCCMYSLKFAHLTKEKLHNADVYEFFIDMRAFGKGYEEFYERIKKEGVFIIRGKTAKITQLNGQLHIRGEDILNNKLIEQNFDMVVLSVGLEPREDAEQLSKMLGIERTEEGWFMETNLKSNPVNTFTGGIYIAGLCQGPKDIPDTVAQGASAASRVLQSIMHGKTKKSIKDLTLEKIVAKAKELSTI